MVWKCEKCNKVWYYPITKCIYCKGDIQETFPTDLRIKGVTEVFTLSDEHDIVPYYVLLVEDADGCMHIRKTFEKYEIGDKLRHETVDEKKQKLIIGVVGTGITGRGIVQVAAQSGHFVILKSRTDEALANAIRQIEKELAKVESQKEKEEVMRRIKPTTDFAELMNADLVIESVIEDINIKKQIITDLSTVCKDNTIIASNTSSLSITELATAAELPTRFIGMHFFNPITKMKLVEVIPGINTSDETIDFIRKTVIEFAKIPITAKDIPGFIVNRILTPQLNEAIFLLNEGVASAEDIDNAIKYGLNHPMGPLELADLIGLDVCLEMTRNLEYEPNSLLSKMVREGALGKKTGRGFYKYK